MIKHSTILQKCLIAPGEANHPEIRGVHCNLNGSYCVSFGAVSGVIEHCSRGGLFGAHCSPIGVLSQEVGTSTQAPPPKASYLRTECDGPQSGTVARIYETDIGSQNPRAIGSSEVPARGLPDAYSRTSPRVEVQHLVSTLAPDGGSRFSLALLKVRWK